MIPLLLGTAIALTALAIVLAPLFADPARATARREAGGSTAKRMDQEVEALREIEFDHETGKLSDSDYSDLRARYTSRAVLAMRAEEVKGAVCQVCGPRPETDAEYCSNCGAKI